MNRHRALMLSVGTLALAACQSSAPPTPAATPQQPAPIAAVKPEIVAPMPNPESPRPTARLAPHNPALEDWKQRAAERIHQVNHKDLFEGRPEHLLRAVIVVEVTVDRQGNVTNGTVRRSPSIASLNTNALRQLRSASPLPAPPATLVSRGALTYHETWLVQKDGRFRLRSLSLPQD